MTHSAETVARQEEQDFASAAKDVFLHAHALFEQKPEWLTFFREVLGVEGVVRRVFRTREDIARFEKTPEHAEIQQMLQELRTQEANRANENPTEPTRVITVRLPKCLHESLKAEADDRGLSMNRLCIAKLLRVIDEQGNGRT